MEWIGKSIAILGICAFNVFVVKSQAPILLIASLPFSAFMVGMVSEK